MSRGKVFWGVVLVLLVAVGYAHWFLPAVIERSFNQTIAHQPYTIDAAAARLHASLFIADLHADSLLWKRDLLRRAEVGHLDLPRLRDGNVGLQVFSATTKSPSGLNYDSNEASSDDITWLAVAQFWPPATWRSLYARADFQLERLRQLAADSAAAFRLILTARDLQRLVDDRDAGRNVIGGVYLIEGAHPLEGEIDNLDRLYERGLRIVGLTHFFDNELGGSLHGVSGEGLSEFGTTVVRRADKLGAIIDVAHASPQMVRDVLVLTRRPVILSHGGFKGHCDTARNLEDELMREIAAAGGLIGVGFWDGAVCDPRPEGIVAAIRYGIDLLGVDHVALGSDYDGAVSVALDASELAILTRTMLDHGFTDTEIRRVMGENAQQFLLRTLPY